MREVFLTVPGRLKESAYALGSTRWEVVWDVVLPYTRSAVIGGIYEEAITNSVEKVPFLGDLPFLGYLFKTTGRTSDKQELLIFLTPRVVKDSINALK